MYYLKFELYLINQTNIKNGVCWGWSIDHTYLFQFCTDTLFFSYTLNWTPKLIKHSNTCVMYFNLDMNSMKLIKNVNCGFNKDITPVARYNLNNVYLGDNI